MYANLIIMEKKTFSKAFKRLRKDEAPTLRQLICDMCGWSYATYFYQKMSGARNLCESNAIGVNEVKVVEKAFKKYGLNAWTGETI